MADPRSFTVKDDDDGIRLDRWFKRHQPDISFNVVSRWARTGQLKLDGGRAAPGDRIAAGQTIAFPKDAPQSSERQQPKRDPLTPEEVELVQSMVIHADRNAFIL